MVSDTVKTIQEQLIKSGCNPRLTFIQMDSQTLKVSRGSNGSMIHYNAGSDLYDVTEYHGLEVGETREGVYAEDLFAVVMPSFSPRQKRGSGSTRRRASL